MVRGTKGISFAFALAIYLLLVPFQAQAAAEDPPSDTQATHSEADDKSYLPPWMQKTETGDAKTNEGQEASSRSVTNTEPAKANIPLQGQKVQRRNAPTSSFLRGFVGLFGH